MAGMVWLAIFATSRSYIEMDRKIKQVFAMDILQCFIKYLSSLPETVEILTTSRGYEVPSILSVLRRCWFGVRKSIRPVKIERWGVGVVICLEWGILTVCIWSSWCHCIPIVWSNFYRCGKGTSPWHYVTNCRFKKSRSSTSLSVATRNSARPR